MRKGLIAVAAGVMLLVAADRISVAIAERQVVPLRTLPLHLRLTSVHVTHGGLRIGATARDVHFARA